MTLMVGALESRCVGLDRGAVLWISRPSPGFLGPWWAWRCGKVNEESGFDARADLLRARDVLWEQLDYADAGQTPGLVAQLRMVLRDLGEVEPEQRGAGETVAQRLRREREAKRGA